MSKGEKLRASQICRPLTLSRLTLRGAASVMPTTTGGVDDCTSLYSPRKGTAVKTARVVFPPWAKAAGFPHSRRFFDESSLSQQNYKTNLTLDLLGI